MKTIFAFGGGAFTFFAGLALFSLLINFSYVAEQPAEEQLLMLAALIGPAIVMSAVGSFSFFLGTKRFGQPPASTRFYLLGILCALLIFFGLAVITLLQLPLSPPSKFAAHCLVVFLVCFFAAYKVARRAG